MTFEDALLSLPLKGSGWGDGAWLLVGELIKLVGIHTRHAEIIAWLESCPWEVKRDWIRTILTQKKVAETTAEKVKRAMDRMAIRHRARKLAAEMEDHRPGGLPAPGGRWADSVRTIVRDALAFGK